MSRRHQRQRELERVEYRPLPESLVRAFDQIERPVRHYADSETPARAPARGDGSTLTQDGR
jgi:hypothetical protein